MARKLKNETVKQNENMARKLKIMENEKHCRTWNMARKLKTTENEKYTL